MFENIYHAKDLEMERKKAAYVIHKLYDYFLKNPDKLPKDFLERESQWGLEVTVADYVAGLTDLFAIKLFEDIFIPVTMFGD